MDPSWLEYPGRHLGMDLWMSEIIYAVIVY